MATASAEPTPANEPEPAPVEEAPAPTEAEIEERVQKLASERFASLQAKHDKKISDLTKERDEARASLESVKADLTSSRAEVEKLTADLAQVRDQLAESERNREAVVSNALARTEANLPTLADGLARCSTPAERSAFIASGKYKRN